MRWFRLKLARLLVPKGYAVWRVRTELGIVYWEQLK